MSAALTEEDVRRIVRDEISRALGGDRIVALPAGPNYLPQPLPMPRYDYQTPDWSPPVSTRSGGAL